MTKAQIFAAGALGAAGPNLLRMAREALLFAQQLATVQGRWRWVRLSGLVDAGSNGADLVAVLGVPANTASADTVPEQVRFHIQGSEAMVRIPAQTKQILVSVAGARTPPLSITSLPGDTVSLQLAIADRSFASGFRRALGLRDFATAQPVLTRRL